VPSLLALTHFNVSLRGMDIPLGLLGEEARVLAENPAAARRSSITDAVGRRPSASNSISNAPEEGATGWSAFSALSAAFGTATSWLHPNIGAALADTPPPPYWAREINTIVYENEGHVPRVLTAIGKAILAHCTATEGIFRRSSNSHLAPIIMNLMNLPLDLQPRLDWNAITQYDPLLPPIMLKKVVSSLRPAVFKQHVYPTLREVRSVDE
jgi:hypothetical protein